MPVTATSLTSGSSSTDASSYATDSITPSANKLLLVAVVNVLNGVANAPTLSGNGLTWVQVESQPHNGNDNDVARTTLFRSMGASPSSGAITIDFAGQTQGGCAWAVSEFDGVDTSGANGSGAVVQSAKNLITADGTTLSVALAAFGASANATFGCIGVGLTAGGITEGAGFTEIYEIEGAVDRPALQTEWRSDNDTSVDWTWVTSRKAGGVAVEIRASGNSNNARFFMGL